MAIHHRIFTSFAIEDRFARDNLIFQAKGEHAPFEFTDMSVKEPWDSAWKTNCRTRIKGCDGVIAMLSTNTLNADGAVWEIRCAIEERIPLLGVRIHKDRPTPVPPLMIASPVVDWTWANIQAFLDRL